MKDRQIEPETFLMMNGIKCECCHVSTWDGKHFAGCRIAIIAKYIRDRESYLLEGDNEHS